MTKRQWTPVEEFNRRWHARENAIPLLEMLERLEWSGGKHGSLKAFCVLCEQPMDVGHAIGCNVDDLLNAANPNRKGGG